MIFCIVFEKYCSFLAGSANISKSTLPNKIVMDLTLASTADKAVKAILPFLKEVSNDEWWTCLLVAWIDFEVRGPPKSVSRLYIYIYIYILI
jgi:hypothetical protein